MTRIEWDKVSDRVFETGLDHGVLYTAGGSVIPWNGLVSIAETPSDEKGTPVYLDGRLVNQDQIQNAFTGTLTAFTYPEEFQTLSGLQEFIPGFFVEGQEPKEFGLSWRTMIGNGSNAKAGYKIHILYHVTATPSNVTWSSTASDVNTQQFSWDLSTIPEEIPGFAPSSYVVLDSTKMDPYVLESIEDRLYGENVRDAFPLGSLKDMFEYIANGVLIRITDNGDGTWSASGPSSLIQQIGDDWFQISGADVTYLTPDEYTISTTEYNT